VAAYKQSQRGGNGPYSSDFEESKVQELPRDNYMPGDRPGTVQANTQRKRYQVDLNLVDPDGSRALQKDWHRTAGFSAEVGRGTQHPRQSSVSSWPSVGADSGDQDHGSGPSGGKFKWK
jgi:hypothetical protein